MSLYRDRHVVVIGGTGALGGAVVGQLVERGALCHVPALTEKEAQDFSLRDHPQVKVSVAGDLSDEAAVAPSILDTPENRRAMPKADHAAWPKVEEVASTILFLASPDNKVTRGAVVPVYGRT